MNTGKKLKAAATVAIIVGFYVYPSGILIVGGFFGFVVGRIIE